MKQLFYHPLWRHVKKWIDKILGRDNDQDNYLDHPYVIF